MNDTPLHRDAMALCGVLIDDLGPCGAEVLQRHLAQTALNLLDDLSLAAIGRHRQARLHDADDLLAVFRRQLVLAYELGLLEEPSYLDLAEQADLVGRQIGGWLKKLRQSG